MRGEERRQRAMVVVDPEERVPREHRIRRIEQLAEAGLKGLSPVFDEMYSAVGRPAQDALSWTGRGADARLPGGCRLQPHPNRQAHSGSWMKPTPHSALADRYRPNAGL